MGIDADLGCVRTIGQGERALVGFALLDTGRSGWRRWVGSTGGRREGVLAWKTFVDL